MLQPLHASGAGQFSPEVVILGSKLSCSLGINFLRQRIYAEIPWNCVRHLSDVPSNCNTVTIFVSVKPDHITWKCRRVFNLNRLPCIIRPPWWSHTHYHTNCRYVHFHAKFGMEISCNNCNWCQASKGATLLQKFISSVCQRVTFLLLFFLWMSCHFIIIWTSILLKKNIIETHK